MQTGTSTKERGQAIRHVVPDDWRWSDGVGYLSPVGREIAYDEKYFENYQNLAKTETGRLLNDFRLCMVKSWVSAMSLALGINLDVGIGAGSFIREMRFLGNNFYGTDINPVANKWLKERGMLWDGAQAGVLTFWDVLEHIPEPGRIFHFHQAEWIFISMPIYHNEQHVFRSKHFKPGEHCWYFTEHGLRRFMLSYGYILVEMNAKETVLAGREDVWSFAFKRQVV